MSRRRDSKKPSVVEGAHWTVRVVCTGRRTHPEVDFGTMLVNLQTGRTLERLAVSEHFGGLDMDQGVALKTIPFVCRRCRPARNVPLKRGTLDGLVRGLADTQNSELDLSALGAIGPISS